MSELSSVVEKLHTVLSELTPDMPIAEVRRRLDDLYHCKNPETVCRREIHRMGSFEAEFIIADGVMNDDGVILYLHGGGFAVCSIKSHRDLCERISRAAHASVLVPEYRLAPEHPFPAGLEDGVRAYEWLLDQGYTSTSIAIMGDSAGGGLALAVILALKQRGLPLPASVVIISPWVDLTLGGASLISNADVDPICSIGALQANVQAYKPDGDVRNPLVSPLFGDFQGFPPMLVQVGEREILLDDAIRIVEVARAAGVEVEYQFWPEQIHVFQIFAHRLVDGQRAIESAGKFIRAKLDVAR